jgi:hypothetical protein
VSVLSTGTYPVASPFSRGPPCDEGSIVGGVTHTHNSFGTCACHRHYQDHYKEMQELALQAKQDADERQHTIDRLTTDVKLSSVCVCVYVCVCSRGHPTEHTAVTCLWFPIKAALTPILAVFSSWNVWVPSWFRWSLK